MGDLLGRQCGGAVQLSRALLYKAASLVAHTVLLENAGHLRSVREMRMLLMQSWKFAEISGLPDGCSTKDLLGATSSDKGGQKPNLRAGVLTEKLAE